MIDFSKGNGLVPVIIQDSQTKTVLMLGYMDEAAYEKTKKEGIVTFYSRSKERLWTKGETSGNFLRVHDIAIDCDGDTILVQAKPYGPVCHTGAATCFGQTNQADTILFLRDLIGIIKDRRETMPVGSYTAKLFRKGLNKIAQKVGEEAVEVIIEAKDANDDLFKGEAADLLFHLFVLLEVKNIALDDVITVLKERHK